MIVSSRTSTRRARSFRRGFKVAIGAALVLIVGWVAYASVHIVAPSQGVLDSHSDAVVSLAPHAYRLPFAEQLVDQGHADTLVISYFEHDDRGEGAGSTDSRVSAAVSCEDGSLEYVVCFTPEEVATPVEAGIVSRTSAPMIRESGMFPCLSLTESSQSTQRSYTSRVFRPRCAVTAATWRV